MADQLINVGFGRETFKTTSAALSAFVIEPPFERTTPNKKYKRQGSVQRFPASQFPEVNGYLYLDSIANCPDGAVILLQASHKYCGRPIRDGAMFIGLRASGPLLVVNATLATALESTITGRFLAFQGRGDLLTVEELKQLGIVPSKNWVNGFMDEEEVAECYTITEMAPALEGKPSYQKMENRDGEVVIVRSRPGRRISIRRPT